MRGHCSCQSIPSPSTNFKRTGAHVFETQVNSHISNRNDKNRTKTMDTSVAQSEEEKEALNFIQLTWSKLQQ
jgi:hypothetical protein